MSAGLTEDPLTLLNRELAKIEFLWKKKPDKCEESRHDESTCSKIAELLACTLRLLQTASTTHDMDVLLKCLNFCYCVSKNKRNRLKMASLGFIPAVLNVLKTYFNPIEDSEVSAMSAGLLRSLSRTKAGREQLVACNGLEIVKQAAKTSLKRDFSIQATKDLDAIICSLCMRCIPFKQLPVPKQYPLTFVLPETDVCRCPAEEASESDEDNLIEVGHVPDVSEFLAAKFKTPRSASVDDGTKKSSSATTTTTPTTTTTTTTTPPNVKETAVTLKNPTVHNKVSLGGCTTSITVTPPGVDFDTSATTVNQTFDPTAAACKQKCVALAELENYRKFCAEFGQNLMHPVFTLASASNGTESPDIFKATSERNYATVGPTNDHLRPSLRRASRSTADMVKKTEPRLTAKNRCSSEQKFNRDSRRIRNPSDPRPESADASPERSLDSKHGSTFSLADHSNGCSNPSDSQLRCLSSDEQQMVNRKHCYYTAKMYAEAAKSVKHVSQFVKLAYPDYVSAHPYLSLLPFKDYHQALLLTVLDELDRYQKSEFEPKTVYDLDKLLAEEREPSELTNNDEERAGIMDPQCDHLKFESRFESGNLRKAIQVGPREYELILCSDINQILEHYAWFYFEVSNIQNDVPYTFKIINYVKSKSLVSTGMQPCVFSVTEAKRGRYGWSRCGTGAVYYRNNYMRPQLTSKRPPTTERCFSTSAFTISFQHRGDVSYVAFHYPYTYTSLRANLARWQKLMSSRSKTNVSPGVLYRKDVLGHTLAGNPIDLVTITAQGTGEQIALRDVIILSSRVHPGESNASWMMQGSIDYLLSDRPSAEKARELYVFKLIPMLNVDGVVNGNHRCSLAGQDLNRQWLIPNQTLHPSVYHTKMLVQFLCSVGKKPLVFCDYHGHSRKKNVFLYGNNPEFSWRKEDKEIRHECEFYTLPEILEDNAAGFCIKDCCFDIQKGKECSARVNMWREMGIERSYTMEASYGGFDRGVFAGFQVGTRELIEMGQQMIDGLVTLREYMDCNRTPSRKFEVSDDDSDDSGLA